MTRDMDRGRQFDPLSYAVLGACIDVPRHLGVHCMEVDYQQALEMALGKRGLGFRGELLCSFPSG